MKAFFPFCHSVSHIPPRRVRPVRVALAGIVEVDVPEISRGDTSLAGSVDYIRHDAEGRPQRLHCEFRTWNGKIVYPLGNFAYPAVRAKWLPSSPDGQSSMPDCIHSSVYGHHGFTGLNIRNILSSGVEAVCDTPPSGKVLDADRERHENIVKRLASDIVIVDGDVWSATEYVSLFVESDLDSETAMAYCVPKPRGYDTPPNRSLFERIRPYAKHMMFDVSKEEGLLQRAGRMGCVKAYENLVVHDGAALAFDAEHHFLTFSMEAGLELLGPVLGQSSGPVIDAWTSVRAALERARSARSYRFSGEEVSALKTVAAACPGEDGDALRSVLQMQAGYPETGWTRLAA